MIRITTVRSSLIFAFGGGILAALIDKPLDNQIQQGFAEPFIRIPSK